MSSGAVPLRRRTYLNVDYAVKSWLVTTDHKRIAVLYMLSITVMFFVGGFAATLMRLELLSPQGSLVDSETYNKLFTMHGVVMIFFFLIPSIPAVLGNFLVPLMVSPVATSFIMGRTMFDPNVGPIHDLLVRFGLPAVSWLTHPTWAMVTLMLID